MKKEINPEVLWAFADYKPGLEGHSPVKIVIEHVSGGLINHTYKVSCRPGSSFLLQQINKTVFKNPQDIQENYVNIWQYAAEFAEFRLPSPRYCGRMTTIFVDDDENYWRAFEFIGDAKMLSVAEKPEQAAATAITFARFTASFANFNIAILKSVIPGFHDVSFRYRQFDEALAGELYERTGKALPWIEELKKRERYKYFYEVIAESGEFPVRVMHHDAKISNILFSKQNDQVICPVDFDTVMPGYFFSDLGDMIRSMACSKDENSTEFDKLYIRKEFYEVIVDNYAGGMGAELTGSEKKYIHSAGLLIIYMQALRFLADYLDGDKYYHIDYPEQNFDRAINQVKLLQNLEKFLHSQYNFTV